MPRLLTEHLLRAADGEAIIDSDGVSTWASLAERVNRWMDVLAAHGIGYGDRLACVLGNRRETFEVLLACLHSGVTVVPVNWHLTAREIGYILADSGCRALVVEDAYAATAARAAARVAVPVRLVLGGISRRDGGHTDARDGFRPVEPLLAVADPAERDEQRCGAVMLYTSGTTGAPKGVDNGLFVCGAPFTRVAKLAEYARVVLGVPARQRCLLDGPWYHSSQLFFALLPVLLGSCLVVRDRFEPAATLEVLDRHRITAAHFVPTQLIRLLRLGEPARRAFSGASLRRVWHGGGPCPVEVKRLMIEWWGPVLVEYYGSTESGAVTLIDSASWLRRPGSVGRAVYPYEIVVVDDTGEPLPPGRTGRVFVRRRVGRTFRYHNAPDKTASAHLRPDTFTLGEHGYLDGDGYLYLTGRAANLIVSGGVNVYPAEVEAVLLEHPAVRDAAVIGVPDDEFGERVVAIVEVEPAAQVDLDAELDTHCRAALAGFKVPREYRYVAALPRDTSGKIRIDALRREHPGLVGRPVPAKGGHR